MSEDTYKGKMMNPFSQNLYTYVENNPLIYRDPSGHIKDSFGAALKMPRSVSEVPELIEYAQNNWRFAQEQKKVIKSGKGSETTCSGCSKEETWKKYQLSMHAYADKIRETNFISVSAYLKAEGGVQAFVGGKIGVEMKGNQANIYYIGGIGSLAVGGGITGGFSITDDLDGNMSPTTGNIGAGMGYILVGEATMKSDDKYIEFSFGGGIGAEASVAFIPINGSFEKETVIKTWDLPFNLSKVTPLYPTYVGSPSVQEWEDMLSGKGW